MELGLAGRRAIVTGGTGGVGGAVAAALLGEGATVVITSRSLERVQLAAVEIEAPAGSVVHPVRCDTGDDEAVRNLVAVAQNLMGGIDVLVNCAAQTYHGKPIPSLEEVTAELLLDEVNVKVMGYLRCARAVAPGMRAQHWGRIVNIGGTAAFTTGAIVNSVRNISVAAVTKNLADEFGRDGVTVNTVHPAITRTPSAAAMIQRVSLESQVSVDEVEHRLAQGSGLGRVVGPEEVAAVVTFLVSEPAGCISGEAVSCGGGSRGVIRY